MERSTRRNGRGFPWRGILKVAVWTVSMGVALLLGGVLLLQLDAVSTAVGHWATRTVSSKDLQLSVGKVEGSWLWSLQVTDLRVSSGADVSQGGWTLSADTLRVSYRLTSLLRRTVDLGEVEGAGIAFGLGLGADTAQTPEDSLSQDPAEPWSFEADGIRVRRGAVRIGSGATPGQEGGGGREGVVGEGAGHARQGASVPGKGEETGELPDAWTLTDTRILVRDLRIGPGFSGIVDTLAGRFRPALDPGDRPGQVNSTQVDDVSGQGRAGLDRSGRDMGERAEGPRAQDPGTEMRPRGRILLSGRVGEGGIQLDTLLLESDESVLHASGLLPMDVRNRLPRDLALQLTARPLHLRDLGPFLPPTLSDSLRLWAEGSSRWAEDGLEVRLQADSRGAGSLDVTGRLTESGEGGRSSIDLHVRDLDPGAWGVASELTPVSLSVTARADSMGAPWEGEWSSRSPGLSGDGRGRLTTGAVLGWALDGKLSHDPARGAPPLPGLEESVLEVAFDWEGQGTTLDSLQARGEVRTELHSPDSVATPVRELLRGLVLRGELQDGEGTATVESSLGGGPVRGEGRVDLRALPDLRASGSLRLDSVRSFGIRVDSARMRLEARGQEIQVRGAFLLEDSTRLRLASRIRASARRTDEGWQTQGTLVLDSSRVGTEAISGGTVTARATPDDAEMDLDLTLEDGGIRGKARVESWGSDLRVRVPEIRFQGLDPAGMAGAGGPAMDLSGTLEGEIRGTVPRTLTGQGRLALDSSLVAGVEVSAASLVVEAGGGRITGRLEGRVPGGHLRLEGSSDLDQDPLTYQAQGAIDHVGLGSGPEGAGPRGSVYARFGLEGEGLQPDAMELEAWADVDSASWDEIALEEGRLRLAVSDGAIRLDTLALESQAVSFTGGGRLPFASASTPNSGGSKEEPGEGQLRLTGTVHRADMLAGLVGAQVLAVGEGEMQAVATGAVDDLSLEAEARVNALLMDEIRLQGLELRGEGRRIEGEGFTAGNVRLTLDRLRTPVVRVRSLEAELSLEEGDEAILRASAIIDDTRETRLAIRVEDVRAPSTFRVERLDLRADEDQWALQAPGRVSLQGGLEVDSLVLRAQGQEIRLQGRLAGEGPLSLNARVSEFRIGTVSDLAGVPSLQGRMSGSLALAGTAEAPRLDATLRSRLEPDDAPPSRLEVSLGYQDRALTMEATADIQDGRDLRLDGTLPLNLSLTGRERLLLDDEEVTMEVAADSFPLEWVGPFFSPEAIRDLRGVVDGNVRLTGQPGAPNLDGSLALRQLRLGLPPMGIEYRDGLADLHFQGERAVLDSLRIRSGDGVLTASGSVTAPRLDEPAYALTARAREFQAMATGGMNATVSGSLEVSGAALQPRVAGDLQVLRADLYLGDLATAPDVEEVTLTEEDYRELARVFGYYQAPDPRATSELLEAMALDVTVDLRRDIWIRQRSNPEMAVQLTGDFSVQKESQDSLRLVGSVEAVPARSYVEQFGRRFSLARGTVVFQGPPATTRLDLRAEYDVPSRDNPDAPEVVIALEITGTPEDLSLELSSSPPLEASDMVSYLVVGQPAGQSLGSGEGGSLSETGGAVALGQLSNAVEAYAREQVGLDVVEIATDGVEGLTLLAGRYVSPDLYLGIRQPVSLQRGAGEASEQAANTKVEVELQAIRWLLLNLQAGGRAGVEFFVRSRVAYD